MTRLTRVVISVTSLDAARPFYVGALELTEKYAMPGIQILDAGGIEVLLHERPSTPSDLAVAPQFTVDDVDATTAAAIAAGAGVIDEPTDEAWGERQAVLRDPDGHVVCLIGPLKG